MNFGLESYEGLREEDFIFPKIGQPVLNGKKMENPKMYIGLPKWGRTEWIGTMYPSKIKEKEYLDYYGQHFNSIELNATHYKLYGQTDIKKWTSKVEGKNFKFCPKMVQGVTHRGSLKGKDFITKEFFRCILYFEEYLGPIFIQVPETFSPKRKEELFAFLKSLPSGFTFFLEVRHEEWFSTPEILDELTMTLRNLKIGLVITDTPNRRDVAHMKLTIPQAFIRFGGFGDDPLDKYRINQWQKVLQGWYDKGLESCYFFLQLKDESKVPIFSKYVQNQLEI